MNQTASINPPVKKTWTEPAVTVIDLRSARHGQVSTTNDGTQNKS